MLILKELRSYTMLVIMCTFRMQRPCDALAKRHLAAIASSKYPFLPPGPSQVVTTTPDATLGEVLSHFAHFTGLPVVDSAGRCVGMLSNIDIARHQKRSLNSVANAKVRHVHHGDGRVGSQAGRGRAIGSSFGSLIRNGAGRFAFRMGEKAGRQADRQANRQAGRRVGGRTGGQAGR